MPAAARYLAVLFAIGAACVAGLVLFGGDSSRTSAKSTVPALPSATSGYDPLAPIVVDSHIVRAASSPSRKDPLAATRAMAESAVLTAANAERKAGLNPEDRPRNLVAPTPPQPTWKPVLPGPNQEPTSPKPRPPVFTPAEHAVPEDFAAEDAEVGKLVGSPNAN